MSATVNHGRCQAGHAREAHFMTPNDTNRDAGVGRSGITPRKTVQSAVTEAKDVIEDATSVLGDAAGAAQEALHDVAGEAQKLAQEAGDSAKAFVEENKGRAAAQIEGINSALSKAADELEAKGQGQFAKYTRDLAGGIDTLTRGINEKSVDELVSSVGQFARSQPAAFLGAAALLGFVSSRFAMSTAKAPTASTDRSQNSESQSEGDASYLSSGNGGRVPSSTLYSGDN
jgi:uncharacterized protein YukE